MMIVQIKLQHGIQQYHYYGIYIYLYLNFHHAKNTQKKKVKINSVANHLEKKSIYKNDQIIIIKNYSILDFISIYIIFEEYTCVCM